MMSGFVRVAGADFFGGATVVDGEARASTSCTRVSIVKLNYSSQGTKLDSP